MRRVLIGLGAAASAGLIAGSLTHRLPMDVTEVLGLVTGAVSVWLTVEERVWNWPVGIANSVLYLAVFFQARLFADAGLQVVYVVLGFLGWYWWLRGGAGRTELPVSRTGPLHAPALGAVLVAGTWGMTLFLAGVHDSAPFLDALTTVLSLIAQYLLTRKLLENWLVWIAADVLYVGLYLSRGLGLTAALYAIFLTMSVVGLVQWRRTLALRSAHA